MKPFHITFTQLITGQFAVRVSTLHWIWAAVQAGISLYGAYKSYTGNKAAGQASSDASYANAADVLNYAGLNADLIYGAADRNAQAISTIGEANAQAVERATERNMFLYGIQAEEEVRRHVIGEKETAGEIRAVFGGSGVQVNTGTPIAYLNSQIDEGIRQRKFMMFKHVQTMLTMKEEGADRASIFRITASENAAVTMANADAQVGIALNDAARIAASMERGGDISQAQYDANASSGLWSGIAGAVGSGVTAYSQYNATSINTQFNTAPPTVAQNTPPSYLTAPGYAGYQPSTKFYSGNLPSWYS